MQLGCHGWVMAMHDVGLSHTKQIEWVVGGMDGHRRLHHFELSDRFTAELIECRNRHTDGGIAVILNIVELVDTTAQPPKLLHKDIVGQWARTRLGHRNFNHHLDLGVIDQAPRHTQGLIGHGFD